MSFVLSEEQRAFRGVMRSFVDERITPNAARYDREQVFPQQSWNACVQMDLPALWIPEEYGGAGADVVTQAVVAEELARGCASTSLTWLISAPKSSNRPTCPASPLVHIRPVTVCPRPTRVPTWRR